MGCSCAGRTRGGALIRASVVFSLLAGGAAACSDDRVTVTGGWGHANFNVSIADTGPERSQGLMNVPDMPLMEEFDLCRRLSPLGRLVLADATVLTSARRWQQHGVIRTYLRMWKVISLYYLGRSPEELARLYNSK